MRFLTALFLSALLFFETQVARALDFDPKGLFILSHDTGGGLLFLCTRKHPGPADGLWEPTRDDIERFELALQKAVATQDYVRKGLPVKGQYTRQYIGFLKNGKRYIYGNYFLAPSPGQIGFRTDFTRPFSVCDGGPTMWGAVFNMETGGVEDIQFTTVWGCDSSGQCGTF